MEHGNLVFEILDNRYAVLLFTKQGFSNMCKVQYTASVVEERDGTGGKACVMHCAGTGAEANADDGAEADTEEDEDEVCVGSYEYGCTERLFKLATAALFDDAAAFAAVCKATSLKTVKLATTKDGPTGGVKGFKSEVWDAVSPKYMTWFQCLKLTSKELFDLLQSFYDTAQKHGVDLDWLRFVEVAPWGDNIWGVGISMEAACAAVCSGSVDDVLSGRVFGAAQNQLGKAIGEVADLILRSKVGYDEYCDEVFNHPIFLVSPSRLGERASGGMSPRVFPEPALNDHNAYEGQSLGFSVQLGGGVRPLSISPTSSFPLPVDTIPRVPRFASPSPELGYSPTSPSSYQPRSCSPSYCPQSPGYSSTSPVPRPFGVFRVVSDSFFSMSLIASDSILCFSTDSILAWACLSAGSQLQPFLSSGSGADALCRSRGQNLFRFGQRRAAGP